MKEGNFLRINVGSVKYPIYAYVKVKKVYKDVTSTSIKSLYILNKFIDTKRVALLKKPKNDVVIMNNINQFRALKKKVEKHAKLFMDTSSYIITSDINVKYLLEKEEKKDGSK